MLGKRSNQARSWRIVTVEIDERNPMTRGGRGVPIGMLIYAATRLLSRSPRCSPSDVRSLSFNHADDEVGPFAALPHQHHCHSSLNDLMIACSSPLSNEWWLMAKSKTLHRMKAKSLIDRGVDRNDGTKDVTDGELAQDGGSAYLHATTSCPVTWSRF